MSILQVHCNGLHNIRDTLSHLVHQSLFFHTECTKDHLLKIALFDFDWMKVGRRLLVSEQNITDIGRDEPNESNRRDAVLMMWQRQKGSSATYRVLAETFEQLQYCEIAKKVKEMEGKK